MQYLEDLIEAKFPKHPFDNIALDSDYESIMANYLAMSQAFPYLQAGSQKDLIFYYMNRNEDVPEHVEFTTVVGNFLAWDETGGLFVTIARGMKGLPRILETRRFHANLLKKDCKAIFTKEIAPEYSDITKTYLNKLYDGLASLSAVKRSAYMVSFENHANRMIEALWGSIVKKFNIDKARLSYFQTHVGGDDPAEAYHVAMTEELIAKTVAADQQEEFLQEFEAAYKLHSDWCEAIVQNNYTEFKQAV